MRWSSSPGGTGDQRPPAGPLTASAALVWSGDLPRPLQQMLFDTADTLTEPAHPQPADLISLSTA